MPPKKKPAAPPPTTGYSHAAKSAIQETTARVQEIHDAIAGKSFDILQKIPLVSGPATWVQSAHNAIATSVYAAIHHGAGGLLEAAGQIEKHTTGFASDKPPGRIASGLRSALNGAFGDHLAASNNRLAINMSIHEQGTPVALDTEALRTAFPTAGAKLCVFIHGLSCDEHSWQSGESGSIGAAGSEVDFGRQLHAEFAYTPLYLRYNTGLPIARNGAHLATLLEELLEAWPQPASELLIIGHSMGGLIALSACEQAAADDMAWPQTLHMLICLGSPNLGSPVERLGHLATSALHLTKATEPLGKIAAARSQGIKDLRHGPGAPRKAAAHHHVAFRFLGASLTEDVAHPFGEFLGDGLVTLGSATAHEIEGDVQSARLGNISHMSLVNDRRVYRQIREWLAAAPETKRPRQKG
jgi:pimeloyl-ACP methyl ester carboxylesterase